MLTGELVTLRPVRLDDLPALYAVEIDRSTWVRASSRPLWPMPYAEFEAMAAKRAGAEEAEFAIDVGGQVVGRCALFDFDQHNRRADLGIRIAAAHRGRGYGKDAVQVLLEYGFNKRNLHRVQLDVLATNLAGLSAYAAVGFVDEGRLREHVYVEGEFLDLVIMGVLRTDWLAARGGR